MTSKKIIERLSKGGWVIDVKNPREVYEVINHAEKSGLKIRYLAERVNMILTDESSNLGNACNDGLSVFYGYSNEAIKDLGMENITDWFFSEINKGDGIGREHLHNILDAWLDGEIIQVKNIRTENWVKEIDDCGLLINLENYYRIKPKQTPLPIPDELWKYIKADYIVLNSDYKVYSSLLEPKLQSESWVCKGSLRNLDMLDINTDGIDWRLSLTKRPEGL